MSTNMYGVPVPRMVQGPTATGQHHRVRQYQQQASNLRLYIIHHQHSLRRQDNHT